MNNKEENKNKCTDCPFYGISCLGGIWCTKTHKGVFVLTRYNLKSFGLNEDDYANLKWEDEPLEVFVNMED